jgi:hypothetical protein
MVSPDTLVNPSASLLASPSSKPLTPRQLQALQILLDHQPLPAALAESNGHGRIAYRAGQDLLARGFVRFEQPLYPHAWVAFITPQGQCYAQGVTSHE